jgi:hypothetical protein
MTASNTSIKGLEQLIKDEVWKPYALKLWTVEEINELSSTKIIELEREVFKLNKCYKDNKGIPDAFMDNYTSFERYVDVILKPFPYEDSYCVKKMKHMSVVTRRIIMDSYTKSNKANYKVNKKVFDSVDLDELYLEKLKQEKALKAGILTQEQKEEAERKEEQRKQQTSKKMKEWRAANPKKVATHYTTAVAKQEAARQIDDSMSIEEISRRIVSNAITKALRNAAVAECRARKPDVLCECGEMIKFYTQDQHRKSKKHITKVNNLSHGNFDMTLKNTLDNNFKHV